MRAIVSGGQTGVDRAALEVAAELGIPAGGWCPARRWAEDGRIPDRYPLRESFSADPAQRTVWNVCDADATLVVAEGRVAGGTRLAMESAERFGRPVLRIEPDAAGAREAREWLRALPGDFLLNVAGPRESEMPGITAAAGRVLRSILEDARSRLAAATRVLVTGGGGCLGESLIALAPPGIEVHATRRSRPVAGCPSHPVELSDRAQVEALLDRLDPAVVIHTAYGTGSPERDIVNATAAVADSVRERGIRLVHMSTDMVLDGEAAPYAEDASPAPISAYGGWKARAETHVRSAVPEAAVVRASLITRFEPPDPRTEWVLSGLRSGSGPALFVDEIRTPILADDLARQIWEIVRLGPSGAGVWHLAGPESFSRFALGALIAAAHGMDPAILEPAWSRAAPGPRPRDLRLLTPRADRTLPTRARPLSEAAAQVHAGGEPGRGD